ncbi:MAG TPA: ABC transporter substrate-binding protein [Candidatus Omnitrophota bacterium]|nr:ABC transporter substrate-binding protein [Candidatus Omnitrophota bacterium]
MLLRAVLTLALGLLGFQASAEDIRIGAFLSSTGQMSLMGDPEKKALEMLVEDANAKGGILGRKLSLTLYDDGSDPDKAVSAVKRLIDSDKVDLIIGGSGTPTSLAVLNVVERAEIPYLSLGGGIGIVDPVRKWTFKFPHTDRMAAEKVLIDLKRRGISQLALLSENVGFGRSGRDQVLKLAPEYGIAIVADETYGPKDPDVTPQLTKIRSNPKAQALFVFGTGQGPAVVTRNIRQLGLKIPVYQSHGVASKDFLRLVGSAADGMRLPAAGMAVPDQVRADDPQKPVVMAFKKAYEARWKEEVVYFAGHSYDAFWVAMEAIQRAGTTDKARVRDEIEKTKGFVGTGGIVTMSPTDHLGLGLDAFHMVEVRNGDWVLVD